MDVTSSSGIFKTIYYTVVIYCSLIVIFSHLLLLKRTKFWNIMWIIPLTLKWAPHSFKHRPPIWICLLKIFNQISAEGAYKRKYGWLLVNISSLPKKQHHWDRNRLFWGERYKALERGTIWRILSKNNLKNYLTIWRLQNMNIGGLWCLPRKRGY